MEQEAIESSAPRIGRYELLRRLARGGMAELFVARAMGAAGFEKQVVIKRVLPSFSRSREWVSMFLDEARMTASLRHPNLVPVFDLGHDGDTYYVVMEYLDGVDVRALVRHCHAIRQPLPLSVVLTLLANAAAGLHAAHTALGPDGKPLGIVHRDVSPSNLFVAFDGTVKVLDFGVAKAMGRMTETRAGIRKGKVAYMSPEQVSGEALDGRSDVFSMGVVLHELTVGRRLFAGDNDIAVARKIAECDAPDPAELVSSYPHELARIVTKSLARDPAERFRSARDMQLALETFAVRNGLLLSSARLAEFMTETYRDKLTFLRLVGAKEGSTGPEPLTPAGSAPAAFDVEGLSSSECVASSASSEAAGDPGRLVRLASEMGRSAARRAASWLIPLICALVSAALTTWLLGG